MVGGRVAEVERWLHQLYVAAEGAVLRREDRRKALEVAAMLEEIERAVLRLAGRSQLVLVDAAAGKSYVGLLAAKLLLEPLAREARVVTIEHDPRHAMLSRLAADRLQTPIPIACRTAEVTDRSAWPEKPSIVAALHACGPAADTIIERSIAGEAQVLLLVPCCTGRAVAAAVRAEAQATHLGIPHRAPVRRRFIQAMVDADRTWVLEAAGYQTEVVEFVGATVTPHNLLWRARRVLEPVRMAAARRAQAQARAAGSGPGGAL